MSQVWDADVDLSMDGAGKLIVGQFPQLAPVTIKLIGQGWDNTAYLVNEKWVFRFPRRKLAAELIENELKSLTAILEAVSLPVPRPEFVGTPGPDYPYPFAGYLLLNGEPACQRQFTVGERASLAEPLAIFLAELHSATVDAETRHWAPPDTIRRADIGWRLPKNIERVGKLSTILGRHGIDPNAIIEAFEGFKGVEMAPEEPCWVHGDFYPCHFLVNEDAHLAGVIDWGDVHLGDRALDLSIAYTFLSQQDRAPFWKTYDVNMPVGRSADFQTRRRAQFRALHYGVILFEYAVDVSNAHILVTALYALRAALND